jgi:hypothetical protein
MKIGAGGPGMAQFYLDGTKQALDLQGSVVTL